MRNLFDRQFDTGLLILRIGMGIMFISHGAPKLLGGPERWAKVGGAMGNLGVTFTPQFWGFMAGLSEFGGGVMLILGVLFRPAMAFMLFTMTVAAISHLAKGQGLGGASHAIEDGIVFLSLIFIGPGKYSLAYWFALRKSRTAPAEIVREVG
jgi:putative oxidoreductase